MTVLYRLPLTRSRNGTIKHGAIVITKNGNFLHLCGTWDQAFSWLDTLSLNKRHVIVRYF